MNACQLDLMGGRPLLRGVRRGERLGHVIINTALIQVRAEKFLPSVRLKGVWKPAELVFAFVCKGVDILLRLCLARNFRQIERDPAAHARLDSSSASLMQTRTRHA